MSKPVRAADDDAPFSESMLQWLEEGDRMGEAPAEGEAGGRHRPEGLHPRSHEPPRRERVLIIAGVAVGGALVLVLRLVGGHASANSNAASLPAAPVASAPAIVLPAAPPAVAEAVIAPAVAAPAVAAPAVAAAAPALVPPVPVQAAARPPEATRVIPRPVLARPIVSAVPAPAVAAGGEDFGMALAACRAQLTAGHIKSAVAACRLATDAQPRSAEALTLLAEAEFTRGHTGSALRLANAASSANQYFADAYVIIGGVYQDKGQNAEARAAYEQYLALQPKGRHAADLRAILTQLP